MKNLKLNSQHKQVLVLKRLLAIGGQPLPLNNEFNEATLNQVKHFQEVNNLIADGIVGPKTWKKLILKNYNFSLGATNLILDKDEWMNEFTQKDTIYLHHTAGLHRPDYTIGWWETDNKEGKLYRVATAFVIGRKSIEGGEKFDGVTYRAFNENYWAHHLGTSLPNNKILNKKSIGIEICSLGHLEKTGSDQFEFIQKTKSGIKRINVPSREVIELEKEWRGKKYFQKYTSAQIEECERLILTLAYFFDIPLQNKIYDKSWFELSEEAKSGKPGLWTHVNVRSDKTDCFPQSDFIEMLNGLYNKSLTFEPDLSTSEAFTHNFPIKFNKEDVFNYSSDLNF